VAPLPFPIDLADFKVEVIPMPKSRFSFVSLMSLVLLSAMVAQAQTTAASAQPGSRHGAASPFERRQKAAAFRKLPDDPSQAIRRLLTLPPGTESAAKFFGNQTAINASPGNAFVMVRETNCTLTAFNTAYTLSTTGTPYSDQSRTPNYEQVIHAAAGLTTTPDKFAGGCTDPGIGIASNALIYVGKTPSGMRVGAFAAYNGRSGNNQLFTIVSQENGTFVGLTTQPNPPNGNYPFAVLSGDLNKDGVNDLISVNYGNESNVSVTVWLGKTDGSFTMGKTYTLPGTNAQSAVLDDFNNDGKLDLAVASWNFTSGASQLTFLPGNGDGTFGTPKTMTVTGTSHPFGSLADGLVAADFNNDGKKDLLSGWGIVFLGKGDGTFTQLSTLAFPLIPTNSSSAPGLAVGDFNKDGKLDVAASGGESIYVFLGKGNGTFTAGNTYASINNQGYLTATDLDGDGNLDLYSGDATSGIFGGDEFTPNMGYALMGNGNGTFQGAPTSTTAVYSGNNLGDFNGDGIPDLITNPGGPTFTVQLGTGKGTYTPFSTITAPESVNLATSAIADINGNGKADLVFLGASAYYTALGNGNGTFQAPVSHPLPQIAPPGNFDISATFSDLQLADLTGNGHQDLILTFNEIEGGTGVSNPYNQGFMVLLGNGDATFKTTPLITTTYSGASAPATELLPKIVDIADLNGKPDLVVVYPSFSIATGATSKIQVYLGKGDGTFEAPNTVNTAVNPPTQGWGSPLVLADFNHDGKLDLACLGETSDGQAQLSISLGNGNGTFAAPTILNLAGGDTVQDSIIAAADFNGDGHVDLALFDSEAYSGVFYGNGNGTFTSVESYGEFLPKDPINLSAFGAATAVDLNKDGKPDILVGGTVLLNVYGETTPPAVSLSATSLAFGNVAFKTESVYQPVTLTNTGGSPLTIRSVALTGTNKTQFLISSNYCPASLAAGANCTIHLHFYPQVTGAATAALTMTDNATGSPQSVTLTGTGVTPAAVSLSTTSIAFGNVTVKTESLYRAVTLTNTGGSPLAISSVALTGTNKTQFLISSNYCPASLAAGANCTIHLHFYPQVTGAATAALTITDNAAGSPQAVTLTGTGVTPAAVSLSTTGIAFGNVTVKTESVFQPVTLTNTGGSPLTISSVALTGTNKTQFLISSNYCPASLAAGANCVIHLHFYPQVTGAATAALTITDNVTGSPQSVTLTGTGK
jgi:hypothetical protein